MSSISRSSKTLYIQGPLFCALQPVFCALVREKALSLSVNGAQTRVLHACVNKIYIFFHVAKNWTTFFRECIERTKVQAGTRNQGIFETTLPNQVSNLISESEKITQTFLQFVFEIYWNSVCFSELSSILYRVMVNTILKKIFSVKYNFNIKPFYK